MKTRSIALIPLVACILLFYHCTVEGSPWEGTATYTAKDCHDEWTLYYYKIYDTLNCKGERKRVSIRENEKIRLEDILANSSDSCVQVDSIKYYWLGIKLFTNGYLKNEVSTFFHAKKCNN